MAVGDLITALRYNNLQSRINVIMGTGSGNSGYGQSLVSAQVAVGSNVDLVRVLNLRTDMIKARQHQTANNEAPSPGTGAFPLVTTADQVTDAFAANLESQMTTIETNKLTLGAGGTLGNQFTDTTDANTSQRTASWNGLLTHNVTVAFGSQNAARFYFNSGGDIRFRVTLTGGTSDTGVNQIFTDWSTMFSTMGTITMNHNGTTRSGSAGTAQAIGFYQLTTSNQEIFRRVGSGNYATNTYIINARTDNAGNVFFNIQFNDNKGGNPNFDEVVTGTLTSRLDIRRATGANVAVTSPTLTTTTAIT
jgi:hypothetical protein